MAQISLVIEYQATRTNTHHRYLSRAQIWSGEEVWMWQYIAQQHQICPAASLILRKKQSPWTSERVLCILW